MPLKVRILALLLLVSSSRLTAGLVNISVSFSGSFTSSQQAIFTAAEQTWETILNGYIATTGTPTSVVITASLPAIDGAGGILGSAGPLTGVSTGGFLYTSTGEMEFDVADAVNLENSGVFDDVVLHEMAHVMGFGTLWNGPALGAPGTQSVYTSGSGQYTGANALAAYKTEFNQPTATFVPVELGGGSGTANGHWNEVDGGAGLTGITDSQGRDMAYELMTGWLNTGGPGPFISLMTMESFRDLGYNVNSSSTPEPAGWLISLLAATGLGLIRRRSKKISDDGQLPISTV